MKSCNEMNELISLHIDNALDDKTRIEFEEHIKRCEECKTLLEEMLHVVHLCNDVDEEELPENFKEQLHNKLEIEKQEANSKAAIWGRYLKVGSTIAAGLLIMIFLKGFMNTGYFMPAKMTKSESQMEMAQNQAAKENQDSAYGNEAADKASESVSTKAEEAKSTDVTVNDSATTYTLESKDTPETKSNGESAPMTTRSPDGAARATVPSRAEQDAEALTITSNNKNISVAVSVDNLEAATDKIKSTALSFGAKLETENSVAAMEGTTLKKEAEPKLKIAEVPENPPSPETTQALSGVVQVTPPPSGDIQVMFDAAKSPGAGESLTFKIQSTEYDKFIALLKESFGEVFIQVGEGNNQDVTQSEQVEVENQENNSEYIIVTVTINKK